MRSPRGVLYGAARRIPLLGRYVPQHRDFLLRMMPRDSVCAEIGVWQGHFSARILEIVRPRALHLIDPWRFQPAFPHTWYGGLKAAEQDDMDRLYEGVVRALGADRRVTIHREFSERAAPDFPDAFFDWIYVDGNHHYESVKRDLELYEPKVRTGGFICGDDYLWGPEAGYPVRRAVDELSRRDGIRLVAVKRDNFILRKV
jgi:hypothetical protein